MLRFSSTREIEVAGQRLGNHADGAAHGIGIFADVMSGNPGRTSSDRNERGHHADQRGFARSIWPQQAEDFFFLHVEGNVIHGGELAVLLDDMVDFDGVARIGRSDASVCSRPGLLQMPFGLKSATMFCRQSDNLVLTAVCPLAWRWKPMP